MCISDEFRKKILEEYKYVPFKIFNAVNKNYD